MKELFLKAYAKINLALAVGNVRSDGYHNLSSIMQTISLYDEIILKKSENIVCDIDKDVVPDGEENIAVKAARAFFEFLKIDGGAHIFIKKSIPSQAGLGGGSADAAAVIRGLNRLYSTGADEYTLCKIGAKVGADVAFLICGGAALAEGVGNVLSKLPSLSGCKILIVKPDIGISTAAAYAEIDKLQKHDFKSADFLIQPLKNGDLKRLCLGLFNDFEDALNLDIIQIVKEKMLRRGAMASLMTGSGSAVFGIYEDEESLSKSQIEFEKEGFLSFACCPIEKYDLLE